MESGSGNGPAARSLTGLELLQTIATSGAASVLTIFYNGAQWQYWARHGMLELLQTPRGTANAAVSSGAAALLLEPDCMFSIVPFVDLPQPIEDFTVLRIPIEELCFEIAQAKDERLLDDHYRPVQHDDGIDWLNFHHAVSTDPLQYVGHTPKTETFTLGRGSACDISIDDPSVSDVHCQVSIRHGIALIEDLGSTNGTFVDERRILLGAAHPHHFIRLGQAYLYLEPTRVQMFGVSDEETRLISRTTQPSTTLRLPSITDIRNGSGNVPSA